MSQPLGAMPLNRHGQPGRQRARRSLHLRHLRQLLLRRHCLRHLRHPYRYVGMRYDPETGLYYDRARMYSSALGRFMQVDPVGYKDDLNLYAYVGNDPNDRADPTGETVAVALRILVATGTLDAEEDAGTGFITPVSAFALGLTTLAGLGYATYEAFQPADQGDQPQVSQANKTPPVPGTGRRAGDVRPAWVKPGQKGGPSVGPRIKKSDAPKIATKGAKAGRRSRFNNSGKEVW
ncbi:MAG TPA: RHS repeat-associated core domain-containing protein [Rhizomicrobium sp.]|nr:RHS repeat-associated core domain-containing protein [Rhizomicrobium sp.]